MKVNITLPGHIPFSKVYRGHLFRYNEGIYLKTNSKNTAVVVYKFAGIMNEGEEKSFDENTLVQNIKEASFIVGDNS